MNKMYVYISSFVMLILLYFAVANYLDYKESTKNYDKLSKEMSELKANQVVNMEYIDSRAEFKTITNFLEAFYSASEGIDQKQYLAEVSKYAEEGVLGKILGPGYAQETSVENSNGQITILNNYDIYMNENGRFLVRVNISYDLNGEIVGPTEIVYSFGFNKDKSKLNDVVMIAAADEAE